MDHWGGGGHFVCVCGGGGSPAGVMAAGGDGAPMRGLRGELATLSLCSLFCMILVHFGT